MNVWQFCTEFMVLRLLPKPKFIRNMNIFTRIRKLNYIISEDTQRAYYLRAGHRVFTNTRTTHVLLHRTDCFNSVDFHSIENLILFEKKLSKKICSYISTV